MNTAARLQDNLLEERAEAQAQLAEGIFNELTLLGEANYWVEAKTKTKMINPPKVLETVTFEDLFEFFEGDLESPLKAVFLGAAEEVNHVVELKRQMNEKAREFANQLAEEAFS